jgi:hypothetical protein
MIEPPYVIHLKIHLENGATRCSNSRAYYQIYPLRINQVIYPDCYRRNRDELVMLVEYWLKDDPNN